MKKASLSVVLDKKYIIPLILLSLGIIGGIRLHAHLRLQHVVFRQNETSKKVQNMNEILKSEKNDLENMLDSIRNSERIPNLNDATAFSDKASQIFEHLYERTDLLTSKEELLWQKELEIEEAQVLVSARSGIETEMAKYINELILKLIAKNMTIPKGLSRRPYISNSVSKLLSTTNRNNKTPEFNFMLQGTPLNKVPSFQDLSPSKEDELAAAGASFLEGSKAEEGIALLSQFG
mmetsp:Transcript_32047/g.37662  ORF Transcript_32047/g.37662 Transcript_32047/m.37662 type:complete len:235 (-) Transcript_32047:27-731(-)